MHYGSILLVPVELEACDPPKPEPASSATPQFWKERENKFRRHDIAENRALGAEWTSLEELWSFRGSGQESPAPSSVQVFKALSREAAKGLTVAGSDDLCKDWLDALRRKTDKSTRKPLYSRVGTTGTKTIGKIWLERMEKFGEPVPPRSILEFVPVECNIHRPSTKVGVAEQRLFWDVTTEKIEHLFTISANLCLELRSLAQNPDRAAKDKQKDQRSQQQDIEPAPVIPIGKRAQDTSTNSIDEERVRAERKVLIADYKSKGRTKGIRITDEMVAKAANPGKWNDRTMVTWWKRNDPRCKPPHAKKIMNVLGRDPALIWPPKPRSAN